MPGILHPFGFTVALSIVVGLVLFQPRAVAESDKESSATLPSEATAAPSDANSEPNDNSVDGNSEENAAAQPDSSDGAKKMSPLERVEATEKGKLKNPYDYKDPKIADIGKKTYLKYSCNGCHGGGGGGGICPPLTNETWVFGGTDDTLFRLVTLGSDGLIEKGYTRIGQEVVQGPMPPYKDIIKDEDDLWKIIAYVRSVWGGRDHKIEW